ncbi:MAG: hypothetical protein LUQ42_05710, partial [Methanomicrobiales archaeon]|nr:hypothetical protein [Methanomicrobiales archaeon]
MENGKKTRALPSLTEIRAAASANLSKLPEKYKALTDAPAYPVELSHALEGLIKRLRRKLMKTEVLNPL